MIQERVSIMLLIMRMLCRCNALVRVPESQLLNGTPQLGMYGVCMCNLINYSACLDLVSGCEAETVSEDKERSKRFT